MSQRKVRIAHIIEGFSGGTCTYMCHVLPQLVERGFDVTLVVSLNRRCPDAFRKVSLLERSGVKIELIPMSREASPFKDLCAFIALLRLMWARQFDIVHTHCSKAGALGRLAAFVEGGSVRIHSPHCFAFLRLPQPSCSCRRGSTVSCCCRRLWACV